MYQDFLFCFFIVLGFNNTTLVAHFASSPREREKRDRRDKREEQGRKRNRNESEETENITFPSTLTCYKDSRACPTVSQYQLDAPLTEDTRHLHTSQPPHKAFLVLEKKIFKCFFCVFFFFFCFFNHILAW